MEIRINSHLQIAITDNKLAISNHTLARTFDDFGVTELWVAIGQGGTVCLYDTKPKPANVFNTWINYGINCALSVGVITWSEQEIREEAWLDSLTKIKLG